MSTPIIPIPELLTLAPHDLADLIDACPGDYVSQRAHALGLDIDHPDHRAAILAAFPDRFTGLSAAHEGVRADLTPESPPAPTGHTGEGTTPDDPHRGSEPVDILDLLAQYRGRPEPFMAGTFALYSAPSGGIVMVTEMPGRGVEQREIPAMVVHTAINAMTGKGGMGLLGRLMRRG